MKWNLAILLSVILAYSTNASKLKIVTEEVENEFRDDGNIDDTASLPFDDESRQVASGNDEFDVEKNEVVGANSLNRNTPYDNNQLDVEPIGLLEEEDPTEIDDEALVDVLANYGVDFGIDYTENDYYSSNGEVSEEKILETFDDIFPEPTDEYDVSYYDYYVPEEEEISTTTTTKKTTTLPVPETKTTTTTTLVTSEPTSTTTTTTSPPIATDTDSLITTTTTTIIAPTNSTLATTTTKAQTTMTVPAVVVEEEEDEVVPDLVDVETTTTTTSTVPPTTKPTTTASSQTNTSSSTTIMPPIIVVAPKRTSTTERTTIQTETRQQTTPIVHKKIYFDVSIENDTPVISETTTDAMSTTTKSVVVQPEVKTEKPKSVEKTTAPVDKTIPPVGDEETKSATKIISTKTAITKGSDTKEREVTNELDVMDEGKAKPQGDNTITPVIAGGGMSTPVIIAIAIAIFLFIIIIIILCAIRNQKNRRGKYIFKKGQPQGGNRDDEEALENGHNENADSSPKKYEAEV